MVETQAFPLFAVFKLDEDRYGILIDTVIQIVHMVAITTIPASPDWLAGVIGFRGRIIPVVDLRVRFGLPKSIFELNTPIIIVQSGKQVAGLIVDAMEGVLPLMLEDLQTPADLTIQAKFINAVTNQESKVTVIPNLPNILAGTQKYDSQLNHRRKKPELNRVNPDPNDQSEL